MAIERDFDEVGENVVDFYKEKIHRSEDAKDLDDDYQKDHPEKSYLIHHRLLKFKKQILT